MWGDLAAAVTVSKLMTAEGKDSKVLPVLATSMPVFRDSAVIIGHPEYSVIVTSLLSGAPLSIEFPKAINEYGVVEQGASAAAAPLYTPVFDSTRRSRIAYGLVTVLPSQTASSGRSKRVILSGTMPAGTQAAAEFISSPDLLRAFPENLHSDCYDVLPEAYQAVVRTEGDRTMALVVEYATYLIIDYAKGPRLASSYDARRERPLRGSPSPKARRSSRLHVAAANRTAWCRRRGTWQAPSHRFRCRSPACPRAGSSR